MIANLNRRRLELRHVPLEQLRHAIWAERQAERLDEHPRDRRHWQVGVEPQRHRHDLGMWSRLWSAAEPGRKRRLGDPAAPVPPRAHALGLGDLYGAHQLFHAMAAPDAHLAKHALAHTGPPRPDTASCCPPPLGAGGPRPRAPCRRRTTALRPWRTPSSCPGACGRESNARASTPATPGAAAPPCRAGRRPEPAAPRSPSPIVRSSRRWSW